jgi:hypothetical protein
VGEVSSTYLGMGVTIEESTMAKGLLSRLVKLSIAFALILLVGFGFAPPSYATIRTFEEAPGQVLTQSRTTLQDQSGNRWQAITFKRSKPDGNEIIGLRLVGFPGSVEIDRSQPLTLIDSLGNRATAAEASAPIFTDSDNPEPHIGQYDIAPVLSSLRPELPLELQLPILGTDPIVLPIAPQTVQEWQKVAKKN